MSRRAARLAAAMVLVAWPGMALAGRLGTGTAPEVPVIRTIGALIICLLVAGLAIFYLRVRKRTGFAPSLRRLVNSDLEIDIRELRRLTVQHSIALVRHGDRDYLLLLTPGGATVLEAGDGKKADGPRS